MKPTATCPACGGPITIVFPPDRPNVILERCPCGACDREIDDDEDDDT